MNILFVNNNPFNPVLGGIERVTDVLTKEFIKRGYNIFYLCEKIDTSERYLLEYKYPAKLYQFPNHGLFDDEENVCFYKKLQTRLDIDIVINQRGLGGYYNGILPITQAKLVCVIHSVPDGDVTLFLNKIVDFSVPPFASFKRFIKRNVSFLITNHWRRKLLKETKIKYNDLAIYSNAIVTLSKKCIRMMETLIDVPHTSIIISIPNPNTFKIENELNLKTKVILYVGRLSKAEKEPLRLLKIWKRLHKKHKEWCLKIVGDGEERKKMYDYVKEHSLNNVYFEGRQLNVAKYYKEASFVCLTSNFEGWGMALTEGMQYGCIPFTFNNFGAASDIIDDGINGCLIPAFDIKIYANRLSMLIRDDIKRTEMSIAAVEKVKLFSVENIANRWEELFLKLV